MIPNNLSNFHLWILSLIKYKIEKLVKLIKFSRVNPHATCDSDTCHKYSWIERQRKGKEKNAKECRVKVTKHNKLQNFVNYSYDKGGGNEMSFSASIQTLAR